MRYLVLVCVAFFPLLAGCDNSKTGSVTGTVTLDGQPVAKAGVMFKPVDGGRMSTGQTDEQGKYSLTCYERNDGALPGEHSVAVTKFEQKAAKLPPGVSEEDLEFLSAGMQQPKKKWIVPEKYSDSKTSGLTFTVDKGRNTANFELQSN